MHILASVAAGLAAGIAFIAVFAIWFDDPPIYRIPSLRGQGVVIPEGASFGEGNFQPEVALLQTGDFVEWVNEENLPTTVVIEPACESFKGHSANVTSYGTEKLLRPGESFDCIFGEAGEYHVYTVPWPHMQGTVRVSP